MPDATKKKAVMIDDRNIAKDGKASRLADCRKRGAARCEAMDATRNGPLNAGVLIMDRAWIASEVRQERNRVARTRCQPGLYDDTPWRSFL